MYKVEEAPSVAQS